MTMLYGETNKLRCVACGRLFPDSSRFNHQCDPNDLPDEPSTDDETIRPIDSGKSLDDRLRDAEIMSGGMG